MTTQEFYHEFNLLYDNIASKGAPGLDEYEISQFLTLAQEELIKDKNSPKSNRLQEGFEASDKRRTDLKELIVDYKTLTTVPMVDGISHRSVFFEIPNDVFLIKQESAVMQEPKCPGRTVEVIPKTLDEYNVQVKNPFKKYNKNKVWRLDYNSIGPGTNVVELISEYPIVQYKMRYLKRANPIILTDLDAGDYIGSGLTILGQTQQQTSELDPSTHSEIVRRAVTYATLSYKENNLQNQVGLYERKE